jgi:hypothetical protein
MGVTVGVVDVFSTPYENWSKRNTTMDEAMNLMKNRGFSAIEALQVNDKCNAVVSTHCEAASYMLLQSADNGLENHIDRALDVSAEYHDLRKLMPQVEPEALTSYQARFQKDDWLEADKAIHCHGVVMGEGQFLFHGGLWISESSSINTSRPFSTSFCPQVALRNAEWNGKVYDAGRVDLMVVSVKNPITKAYVYSRSGNHGNEKEIVFASGAQLTRVSETRVTDVVAYKMTSDIAQIGKIKKLVPAYVLRVEIS